MHACIKANIFIYLFYKWLENSHASCLQAVFAVALGPFTFFNIQKTKYLQLFTTVTRWLGKIKKHTRFILSVTLFMHDIFSFYKEILSQKFDI